MKEIDIRLKLVKLLKMNLRTMGIQINQKKWKIMKMGAQQCEGCFEVLAQAGKIELEEVCAICIFGGFVK